MTVEENIPRQDFVMMNISCEFDISTYSTFCSRVVTKVLAENQKMPLATILFFQNEAKNIPRQDFVMINVSCKFEKSSYNFFFLLER